MERVLECVYTDGFPSGLAPEWLTPAGAEALFDAADMLLLFSVKVRAAPRLMPIPSLEQTAGRQADRLHHGSCVRTHWLPFGQQGLPQNCAFTGHDSFSAP